MQTDFKLYKVDMKYIRNLHNIDDKVLSVSPQTGKDNRVFVGIVIICGIHKYCIPLSSPKEKHKKMKNSMDFSSGSSIAEAFKAHSEQGVVFNPSSALLQSICKK